MDHNHFMEEALKEARRAYECDEVPIGAVIVKNNVIIAKGHNLREKLKSPLAHAEIVTIEAAGQALGSWNLSDCTLYVTVEPCPMCAGAVLQAQISHVVFGLSEPKSGSFGSVIDLSNEKFNHKPEIIKGVLEEESKALMQSFFQKRREKMVKVHALKQSELESYFDLRVEVFVGEQNVPLELEYDEYDLENHEDVTHVGAFINHVLVGAMRLIRKGSTLKVGRLAVNADFRKDGVGSALLNYAETQAKNNGFKTLELGAQVAAEKFYEKNGYVAFGDLFLDADIDHIMMKKVIK